MNLIEQLGGYEAAKRYAESRNGADNTGVYDSLQAALLEYRRANNIYEVGDWVVLCNWDNNSNLYKISRVYEHKFHNGDGYVKSSFVYNLKEFPFDHWFNKQDIRHATNEEIEAGKRLEVV